MLRGAAILVGRSKDNVQIKFCRILTRILAASHDAGPANSTRTSESIRQARISKPEK